MYRITYYGPNGNFKQKDVETLEKMWKFVASLPNESVTDITHYEDSDNNRPTFWGEE